MIKVLRKRTGTRRTPRGNRLFFLFASVAWFTAGLFARDFWPEWSPADDWRFAFDESAEDEPAGPCFDDDLDIEAILSEAVVFEELQMRGEEGRESAFLLNAAGNEPYGGWARQTHPNGQAKTVYLFNEGKLVLAKGWNSDGEPDGTGVIDGCGFVVESDDPEVGYFYDEGFQVAFKNCTDSGMRYRKYFADGRYVSWHANGNKREQGRRDDGLKEGTWMRWHPSGKLSHQFLYKEGRLDGRWIEWHENGQRTSEIHFSEGKPDGIWYEWYDDGGRKFRGLYEYGKPMGNWEGWHENGRVCFRKQYRSGELYGPYWWWKKDGTLYKRNYYLDGIPAN